MPEEFMEEQQFSERLYAFMSGMLALPITPVFLNYNDEDGLFAIDTNIVFHLLQQEVLLLGKYQYLIIRSVMHCFMLQEISSNLFLLLICRSWYVCPSPAESAIADCLLC